MSSAMLKAILWDNDGVLVDTEGLYFQACRETLERLGVRLSEARFIELFLKASEGLTKVAAEHGIDEQALEPARIWRNARYTELLRRSSSSIRPSASKGIWRIGYTPVIERSTISPSLSRGRASARRHPVRPAISICRSSSPIW